jgi:hypothetical protein
MKRSIRTTLAAVLIAALAAPTWAEQATLRIPPPEPAQKGENVVVTLRDGREIRGAVGKWLNDLGFYVKPADTPAWLIHPEDIMMLRNATSGLLVSPPVRHHGMMSTSTKVLIGIGATVGGLLLLGKLAAPVG